MAEERDPRAAAPEIGSRIWGKPKCRGCIYAGVDIPCEYILKTGRSPQKDGAHIDPEGEGGCELYAKGEKQRKRTPILPEKKRREETRWRKVNEEELRRLWKAGKTDGELAEALDCSKRTIREWRQKTLLPANVHRAQRSRFDAPEIRAAWERGAGDMELARLAGASRSGVQKWRNRNGLACNDHRYRKEDRNGAGTIFSGAGPDAAAEE